MASAKIESLKANFIDYRTEQLNAFKPSCATDLQTSILSMRTDSLRCNCKPRLAISFAICEYVKQLVETKFNLTYTCSIRRFVSRVFAL